MCKDLGNYQFECQGNCNSNATIWGTGLYTGDSNVFQAAKHMGITPGKFRRVNVAGTSAYLGTTMNGIVSTNYGNYANSYFLVSIAGANNAVQCTGAVTQQSLTNIKNELKTAYQTESNGLKTQIQLLKKELTFLNFQLIEKVNNNQQKTCEKQTKTILNAMTKDVSICAICMDKQRTRVVFPCFHASYCEDCIVSVRQKHQCAICQGKITGDLRIIL